MVKITKPSTSSRNPSKRHSTTSVDSPIPPDPAKDAMKNRKAHSAHVRASKARASMACERCKHKKVKCEDYVEGLGCEKCRMNNEICYFHRKEPEIKTSFRQGYVENCERECEHLKELVVRMYKEASEGTPIKSVELVAKDGHPNITSLMHAYGVALGEEFLGTYEARDARLAHEGQPMLSHNGKGDIILPREGAEAHHVLPSVEESASIDADHDSPERISQPSRSPSVDHYTSTNSQPMSRQSSTGSLFSNHSIPKRPLTASEDTSSANMTRESSKRMSGHEQQSRSVRSQQQDPNATVLPNQATAFGGMDNWSSVKSDWAPSTPFSGPATSSLQNFNGNYTDGFVKNKAQVGRFDFQNTMPSNTPFSPSQQHQSMPFSYLAQDNMFQADMAQGFPESISPEDMQMSGDGFFDENFMQGADNGMPFDYLDNQTVF